mmetsp:Transcript_104265/g.185304  ORF Transcript_104265/g.185304 Transcript_104265/m.185304 type:complete len:248 (+) Transcript_104265:229-972(+)
MHADRWNGHDRTMPSCRLASGLLHEKRHRCCFVEQSQLSVPILRVSWISKNATVEQGSVHVTDHGPDVTQGILLTSLTLARLNVPNVILHWLIPIVDVCLIHRVDLTACWDLQSGSGQHVFSDGRVQGEADDAPAQGEDKLCRAGVKNIAGGHKSLARLQGTCQTGNLVVVQILGFQWQIALSYIIRLLEDAKNGSDRDASIHVAATIKRVKHTDVLARVGEHRAARSGHDGLCHVMASLHRGVLFL